MEHLILTSLQTDTRKRGRSLNVLRLLAVWAVTYAGLYYAWPMAPRFSIPDADQIGLIGVTPDSRHLVAQTLRAMTADENLQDEVVFSGPMQIWDLQSGERHVIKLPHQKETVDRVLTSRGIQAIVDPDRWKLQSTTIPLNGNRSRFVRTNRCGERFAVEIDLGQGVIVNDTELPRVGPPSKRTKTEISPNGRWIADIFRDDAPQRLSEESLKLIDCKTGMIIKEFAPSAEYAICFSEDDSMLAVSNGFTKNGTTTLWHLEPVDELLTTSVSSSCLRFSPSNRQIAVCDDVKVVIFDVETGATRHNFPMNGQIKALRFASDELHFFGYNFVCGSPSSGAINHYMVSEVQIWNLATDHYVGKRMPVKMSHDVNPFPNGWVDGMS